MTLLTLIPRFLAERDKNQQRGVHWLCDFCKIFDWQGRWNNRVVSSPMLVPC